MPSQDLFFYNQLQRQFHFSLSRFSLFNLCLFIWKQLRKQKCFVLFFKPSTQGNLGLFSFLLQSPPKGATIPYRPSPLPGAVLLSGNQVRISATPLTPLCVTQSHSHPLRIKSTRCPRAYGHPTVTPVCAFKISSVELKRTKLGQARADAAQRQRACTSVVFKGCTNF